MVKMTTCKFTCKDVYFCYFIEQQPDSPTVREFFPELCMAYIAGYRDFSLAFSLDFLDLATFLRQIFLFFCQFAFFLIQTEKDASHIFMTHAFLHNLLFYSSVSNSNLCKISLIFEVPDCNFKDSASSVVN